jgi:predicted nucleic acid-binding protein
VKVVIDTNIYFSALLNSSSYIGDIILKYGNDIQFYSPKFLLSEIEKHRSKIVKISKLNLIEISQVERYLNAKISFISEDLINDSNWRLSAEILENTDVKDVPFLALAFQLEAKIWTGDKKMIQAISTIFPDIVIDTTIFKNYLNLK